MTDLPPKLTLPLTFSVTSLFPPNYVPDAASIAASEALSRFLGEMNGLDMNVDDLTVKVETLTKLCKTLQRAIRKSTERAKQA